MCATVTLCKREGERESASTKSLREREGDRDSVAVSYQSTILLLPERRNLFGAVMTELLKKFLDERKLTKKRSEGHQSIVEAAYAFPC